MRLPETSGTYVLWLASRSTTPSRIGKLGTMILQPGIYAYVGSALGPGGLAARLRHHFRTATRPHWHIDYLRQQLVIEEVWYACGEERLEHRWAGSLQRRVLVSVPLQGFGSSDCDCPSHLFFMRALPSLSKGRAILQDPEMKMEIQALRPPGQEWNVPCG